MHDPRLVSIQLAMVAGAWRGRLTVAGTERATHTADHLHTALAAMVCALAIVDCDADRPARTGAAKERLADRAQLWTSALEGSLEDLAARVRGMR